MYIITMGMTPAEGRGRTVKYSERERSFVKQSIRYVHNNNGHDTRRGEGADREVFCEGERSFVKQSIRYVHNNNGHDTRRGEGTDREVF